MLLCFSLALSLFYVFHVNYLVANNIATLASWVYSYCINKLLCLKTKRKKHLIQGTSFFVTQAVFLVIANVILYFEVEVLGLSYSIAIFILAAVMAFINFTCMKMLIFKRKKDKDPNIKEPQSYTERNLQLQSK